MITVITVFRLGGGTCGGWGTRWGWILSNALVPWFDCRTETCCSSATSCPFTELLLNFLLLGFWLSSPSVPSFAHLKEPCILGWYNTYPQLFLGVSSSSVQFQSW